MNYQKCAQKMVKNLPENQDDCNYPSNIDVVLDGGTFNGSYLLGSMYFLKELQLKKYIKIDRISCSSISTLLVLGYTANILDMFASTFYKLAKKQFKTHHNLNKFDEVFQQITPHLPSDICERMNDKVYMTYYNMKTKKKIVKSKFKNVDDIFETIRRSCHIPFFIDGQAFYKDNYIDGMNPHFFEKTPDKSILYIDLFGYDKLRHIINIQNEKTNEHRILTGLLDIQLFFTKNNSTSMCSFIHEWGICHRLQYYTKQMIEYIVIRLIYMFRYLIINKRVSQVMENICCMYVQSNCV